MIETAKHTVLVLGASSWLGYVLTNALINGGFPVVGTVYKSTVKFPEACQIKRLNYSPADYAAVLNEVQPKVIVNFLRGEDQIGTEIHRGIIEHAQRNSCHYIFASSALALDGYEDTVLTEDLPAKSSSPYGIFKANCETALEQSKIDYTILRFASVQGWVAHKVTRNEVLLKKLKAGTEIVVDRGIVQNRLLASVLIAGIIDIIKERMTGIIHFGTQDESEEYHFLQKQAILFGYHKDLVQAGPQRKVNLAVKPGKMAEVFGDKYVAYESETLAGLKEISGLKKYQHEG